VAEVEIAIPGRPAYVRVVRLALASLARLSGLGEEAVEDLKIAVGEACANAVLMASEASAEDPVKITWRDDAERIVIEVGDAVSDAEPITHEARSVDSSGFSTRLVMSTALLHSLVDECDVVRSQSGRLHSRLVVNRSGA
jgi:anti-sigma regulatory factor (Ser/Thr protein kinase)